MTSVRGQLPASLTVKKIKAVRRQDIGHISIEKSGWQFVFDRGES